MRESQSSTSSVVQETDVVVIGSGIAGLSAAALLATYGENVVVCESHTVGVESGLGLPSAPTFDLTRFNPPGHWRCVSQLPQITK